MSIKASDLLASLQGTPAHAAVQNQITTKATPATHHRDMNRWESQQWAIFRQRVASGELQWVEYEAVTFKLAADTRYTPDFTALDAEGQVWAYEVKGFWRDDAKVKVKVAARMFPWVRFVIVTREKGEWKYDAVKP